MTNVSKLDFTIKFIKDAEQLRRLADVLITLPNFALDIETVDWWNRHQERIALVQFAYRSADKIRVVIVDALADLNIEMLRPPLENSTIIKIIHNASFDAARLEKHYQFKVAPVFDTMVAARRSGEKKYSLKAQAETHLNIRLDKTTQTSDWSRRPLDVRQLHYAALDPLATLLLYENQKLQNLNGEYYSKAQIDAHQHRLPLRDSLLSLEAAPVSIPPPDEVILAATELALDETEKPGAMPKIQTTLLGIIAELPSRYHPDGLAASIGVGRIGLAGWIIDKRLGRDAEPDEETVRQAIVDLCERRLIVITGSRRLEATESGRRIWRSVK